MSYTLNSLKGIYMVPIIWVIRGDTRSLDCSSYTYPKPVLQSLVAELHVSNYWVHGPLKFQNWVDLEVRIRRNQSRHCMVFLWRFGLFGGGPYKQCSGFRMSHLQRQSDCLCVRVWSIAETV